MKRLRQFIESILYAGMKSHEPADRGAGPATPSRFLRPFERFLSGPGSADPLYITNRTAGQKIRLALLIAIPPLLVLGLATAVIIHFNQSARPKPPAQMSNAEIAVKMLSNLSDVTVYSNKDIDVMDLAVHQSGGSRVTGTLKNNSDHAIAGVEVIFDLTNAMGSRLAAVSCKVARLEPKGRAKFETAIAQKDAAFAIVREIRIQ
jgi:hypothetical protein